MQVELWNVTKSVMKISEWTKENNGTTKFDNCKSSWANKKEVEREDSLVDT